jgi:putative transposase
VRRLCEVLKVHPSGYYAWKRSPQSARAKEDQRLLGLVKQSWLESGGVYGYRKITVDVRDLGESSGKHRIYRLMRSEGLRSTSGYRRRKGNYGRPSIVAPNQLQQNFDVEKPNQAWVSDITYIRTHEGWLYLAVVIDLFSRQVIGWSMSSRIDTELVIGALLMAVWRRQPDGKVIVHSDQGCPIQQPRLEVVHRCAQPRDQYESSGQLLRQRSRRELLSIVKEGANSAEDLQGSG